MVRENAEGQTTGEVIVMVETGEDSAGESVPDRVEQVARDAGIVAFRGAEVVTNRRLPEVRRAALDLASVAGVAVALVTAFAFGNWAAASALSTAVRDWVAALILASTWIVVAVLLAALLLRGERSLPRNWRRLLARDAAATLPSGIVSTSLPRRSAPRRSRRSLPRSFLLPEGWSRSVRRWSMRPMR